MTTQQLITRVDNYLAYDLDGYFGTAPTDAQVVAALNDALLDVADAAYLVKPDIALTLTESQYSYAFDSALAFPAATLPLKVLKVVVNGNVLKTMDGRRSGLWTMREVEDLSYEEIAEAIGIPVGTVKSRLNRARNSFRSLLPVPV